MNTAFRIACAAGAFSIACQPTLADDFNDRLQKMPAPAFTSQKSLSALEWCLGTGVGEWMPPYALHGEDRLLVYGAPNAGSFVAAVYTMVMVIDAGAERTIAFNAHKAWDDKTAALIRACI
jgi:hypothetical protein